MSKCQFGVPDVIYLGHGITTDGIFPDERKVEAIKGMPTPATKKDIQRFLGNGKLCLPFCAKSFRIIVAIKIVAEERCRVYLETRAAIII